VRQVTFALTAILAAIVAQTAVLDRLPFPGGSAPDLVLVLVVTLALANGPMEGMLMGFGAGLALDMAPPAGNLLGLSALVFCVIGYGCGRLRAPLERSAWLPLAVVALGVTAGEALYALVGMTFGDPDITWQSARMLLPVSVAYGILLSPFVVYAVVRFGGYGGWAASGARRPELAGRALAGAGLLGGAAAASGAAVRDTRSGRGPRLRAAAARQADGWVGGHRSGPGRQAGPWVHRRRPLNLRARDGVAGSAAAGAARRRQGAGPGRPGTARPLRLRLGNPRRGDGVLGGSLRALLGGGLAGVLGNSGGGSRMRGAAFRGSAAGGGPGGLAGRGPAGLVRDGSPGGLPRSPSPSRLPARAFRGAGGPARALGDGSSRGPLRAGGSLPGTRLRARAFRGAPSAVTAAGRGRSGRPARLRLRRRRGDGALGGGVRGGRASGSGRGAAPRFRGSGRGLLSWGDRILSRRRGSMPGRGFSGGTLSGGGGGPGGRRRGLGGGRRRRPWRRRSAPWRIGNKRTGGLP
jgi:rod shape-determining protein MreD